MMELEQLTPQQRDEVQHLVQRIAEADGVAPTNESADLVIAGQRPGSFFFATAGDDLVGFAVADARDGTIQAGVLPGHRRRGHGTSLLRAALEAHPHHTLWAFGTQPGAAGLAGALGLTPVRELLKMARPLGEEPEARVPAGWTIRAFRPSDADGVVATNAAAFAHHPEQGRLTRDEFDALTSQPWFSAEGLLVATRGYEDSPVVGFHWTKRHDEATGEVYVLAVHPDHEGHGLGRALLEAGLAHLEAVGCTEVVLFVEASEERVVAMYRSASFVTSNTDTSYQL
ncbi:mycothiol synthase [Tessaracoccus antarcticus]|uniref:Mycothiol acetyltransferase n=1 Tax=Tessaracoccus antarcticus TaxID=2479848 RepID=A0A3M0GA33_9ACTN|nr:mycothiol synthase [Tessaracoccus antarcticus]RMB61127.1 mycothiol synthase [Tessaracoccus antarcticus]